MSEEQEARRVGPLADMIGIDLGGTENLSIYPERVDDEMKKKLKNISWKAHQATDFLIDGLTIMGKLMWVAGSGEKDRGDEQRLLVESGIFIENLAQMLGETWKLESDADCDLINALECRLNKGKGGVK